MPKVVTSTKGTAGDDHEALVRKAHEVTKGVQKEAAAVVKHVNKVSKTIDKRGIERVVADMRAAGQKI